MTTFATQSYYVRDGKRFDMKNGRSGIAEAMQTSPASETTDAEVIMWEGGISQLQVANGPNGGRFSVLRSQPLNVRMEGAGAGDTRSVLRSLDANEKYKDGHIDRVNPAIHRLVWTDLLIDVTKSQTAYPIVTGVNTALGTFGFRRVEAVTPGLSGTVKTTVRGNASGRYILTKMKQKGGVREYGAGYFNAGPGATELREIECEDSGRGAVQCVYRTTENGFYTMQPDSGSSLLVEDIRAINCGADGGSAVSVTGWSDHIEIRDLYVDSHWNTAAISLRYDKKQALLDDPKEPKKANVIGSGKLLASGRAHGTVVLDLYGSYVRTGVDMPNNQSKSSRPAIMVDSCDDLWITSDYQTSIKAGAGTNKALHVEHSGAGDIRTWDGVKVGTRGVGSFKTSGNFSGWGPTYRNGQPVALAQYLSKR